jgi:hypothetical protein
VPNLVLLERAGALWGVVQGSVSSFAPHNAAIAVVVADSILVVDRVVGLSGETRVWPSGVVMRRYWPRSCAGLAVCSGRPVVVIDPTAPPPELALRGEGEAA